MTRTKIEHPSTILASMLQLSVISGDFSKEIRFVFKIWQLKNSTKHSFFCQLNFFFFPFGNILPKKTLKKHTKR
jgi:hypothetical protein